MKTIKKIFAGVITTALVLTVSMTALAASGINANEQSVLDKAATTLAGVTTATSAQVSKANGFIGEARSYMNQDGVDLTADQASAINASITEAATLVANAGDLSQLSASAKKALAESIAATLQKGATAAGINVVINSDGSFKFISQTTGKVVASTKAAVKATGTPVNTTYAVIAAMVVALGGCAIFAKRKNLFA